MTKTPSKEIEDWWQELDIEALEKRKMHLINKAMDCDKERAAIENLIDFLEEKHEN